MPTLNTTPLHTKLVNVDRPVMTLFIPVVVRNIHLGPLLVKNPLIVLRWAKLNLPRAWATTPAQFRCSSLWITVELITFWRFVIQTPVLPLTTL